MGGFIISHVSIQLSSEFEAYFLNVAKKKKKKKETANQLD